MSIANFPGMLISERLGWPELDRSYLAHPWLMRGWVLLMSLAPPLLYAYSETTHPGVIFPLSVPALTAGQLFTTGLVLYVVQLCMVAFFAMLIQRMALARDHDPGYEGAFALATVTATPMWLASFALLVPSPGFNLAMLALGLIASIALIYHGARPLLHINDEHTAHYVAETVTLTGIAAWIGLLLVAVVSLSIIHIWWSF